MFTRQDPVTGAPAFSVTSPAGPCDASPGRTEPIRRLSAVSSPTPPISLDPERDLDFTQPFCIAFTVTLPDANMGLLFNIMNPPLDGPSVGSLMLGRNGIRLELGGSQTTFSRVFPAGFVHLQICVVDGTATLYENCQSVLENSFPQPAGAGIPDDSLITFLQNSTISQTDRFWYVRTYACITDPLVYFTAFF